MSTYYLGLSIVSALGCSWAILGLVRAVHPLPQEWRKAAMISFWLALTAFAWMTFYGLGHLLGGAR